MGFDVGGSDEVPARADPFVESEDWSVPRLPAAPPPPEVWFVDGVRRVDLRLVADDVAVGRGRVRFDPASAGGTDPNAALQRLQDLMREEERYLASRLVLAGAGLVLLDGPLRLGQEPEVPAVGVVKRFARRYLEPEQEALLGALGPGERTPVFGLLDQQGRLRGFSWYTRIAVLRGPWHDHAGIARCEVRASLGDAAAFDLADRVTALLPRFAGRAWDPRTPQNLVPVGGLESWLRHRMGDRAMIRRALLNRLSAPEGDDA